MLRKLLIPRYYFAFYTNQYHRASIFENGKEIVYDANIAEYGPLAQAFLQKRWILKEEVPAKIYIIDTLQSLVPQLRTQKLIPMKKLLEENELEELYKKNMINSQYLISVLVDDHFKSLCDEYQNKVLVNGSTPHLKDWNQYQIQQKKVLSLYSVYFEGMPLTPLEKEIEFKYISQKQLKWFRYVATQKSKDKCIWTYSQQRKKEKMLNWRAKDPSLYDDFRQIYTPLKIFDKLRHHETIIEFDQIPGLKRFFFNLLERSQFKRTQKRAEWIVQTLVSRTIQYISCHEFRSQMLIPSDFHIDNSLINVHVWMLIDRLLKLNNSEAKFIANLTKTYFTRFIEKEVSKIHLRKKNELIKDVDNYMRISTSYLEYHFNRNPKTIVNNYYKLDALVWSIIFFEKLPRYSEQVYMMAEYLKTNYDYIQTLEFVNFEDCNIQFDVYKNLNNYKQKVLLSNKPLQEQEFMEEFLVDKKKKKYYYSYEKELSIKEVKEIKPYEEQTVEEIRRQKLNSLFQSVCYH